VESIYSSVFDQIPNLQNCKIATPHDPKQNPRRGPKLPPSTFTGQFLRKADI
jgi:hypothetical protein